MASKTTREQIKANAIARRESIENSKRERKALGLTVAEYATYSALFGAYLDCGRSDTVARAMAIDGAKAKATSPIARALDHCAPFKADSAVSKN